MFIALNFFVENCVSLLQGFWDRESGIKYPASRAFFLAYIFTLYESFAWPVYVRTYCVSIATLNQNKRSRKLYLGDTQTITWDSSKKGEKNCFQEDPFLKIQRSRRERWRSEKIYGTYLLIFHCLAKTTGSFFQPFLCFVYFFHSKKYCSEHQIIFTREVWFH